MHKTAFYICETLGRVFALIVVCFSCLSADTSLQPTGPKSVAEGWVKAFNAHDAVAFGRLYTEDADWVNVVGVRVKSREHIQAAHKEAFETYFRQANITTLSISERLVRPDVAIVHLNWALKGQVDTESGKEAPPRRGIVTVLAVKQQDSWKIAAGQNSNSIFREQLWAPGIELHPQD